MRAPSNRYREQRLAGRLASSTRKIRSTSGYPRQPSIPDLITFAVHANRGCGGRSWEFRGNGACRTEPCPHLRHRRHRTVLRRADRDARPVDTGVAIALRHIESTRLTMLEPDIDPTSP
jgi:hypothetical protein